MLIKCMNTGVLGASQSSFAYSIYFALTENAAE